MSAEKKYRLAVCKGPDCRLGGANAVFAKFQEQVAQAGLAGRCEVYRGGCYGLCHLGPNVVVREHHSHPRDPLTREDYQLMGWEGEVHYGKMSIDRVERVVREHLTEGAPVPEFQPPPGSGLDD